MIDFQDLEQRLKDDFRREGLIGAGLKVLATKPRNGHFAAHINLERWGSEFSFDPEYEPDEDLKIYAMCKGIDDILLTVSKTAVKHETGHWKFCPWDHEHHDIILDAVYRALEDAGLDEKKRKKWCDYITNLFEDTVVNPNKYREGDYEGQFVFFYDQGTTVSTYTKLFEFHVKLHDAIFNDPLSSELVSRFYHENAPEVHPIVDALNAKIGTMISDKVDYVLDSVFNIKGKSLEDACETLRDKKSWERTAYAYASTLVDLIPKTPEKMERLSAGANDDMPEPRDPQPGDGDPQPGDKGGDDKDGQGAGGEDDEGDGPKEDPGPDPSSFDDEFNDDENQKKVVACRYQKGKPLPHYMDKATAFDHLYTFISSDIPIKAKTKGEGWNMPLVVASSNPFDPREHKPSDLDTSRVVIDPEEVLGSIIGFEVPELYHTVNVPLRKAQERMPDIMYLFDCSGSMSGNGSTIPWESGNYHYALLGIYGSIKWLQRKQIAPYIKYNGTMFSDSTLSSGWKDYAHLNEVKELFWKPQFGGTRIIIPKLKAQLENRDPCIILMLSDGGITGWSSIRSQFHDLTSRHLLYYIQLGSMTQTGNDIVSWGNPVSKVTSQDDLRSIIVDLTKLSMRHYLNNIYAAQTPDSGYFRR